MNRFEGSLSADDKKNSQRLDTSEVLREETPGETRLTIPKIRHIEVSKDGRETVKNDPGVIAASRRAVEQERKESLSASVETNERVKAFIHRVEGAIEMHYQSLGVLEKGRTIAWNDIIEVDTARRDEGSPPRTPAGACISHTEFPSKALLNDFEDSDSFAKAINLVEKLKLIIHERGHSESWQGELKARTRVEKESENIHVTLESDRMGATFNRLRGAGSEKHSSNALDRVSGLEEPALEEGAATTAEKLHEHIIAEMFPGEYRIYQNALERLKTLPDPAHGPEMMTIAVAFQKGKEKTARRGWRYPNSFKLVSYLKEEVPGFEVAFAKMRLYSNRLLGMSETRRLTDGHFGEQGVFKDLLLTKEKNAGEMLERLKKMKKAV